MFKLPSVHSYSLQMGLHSSVLHRPPHCLCRSLLPHRWTFTFGHIECVITFLQIIFFSFEVMVLVTEATCLASANGTIYRFVLLLGLCTEGGSHRLTSPRVQTLTTRYLVH